MSEQTPRRAAAASRTRIAVLEQAIVDACTAIGRQVVCDNACDDPYCILARALGRNPVPQPRRWRTVPWDYGDPRSNR